MSINRPYNPITDSNKKKHPKIPFNKCWRINNTILEKETATSTYLMLFGKKKIYCGKFILKPRKSVVTGCHKPK